MDPSGRSTWLDRRLSRTKDFEILITAYPPSTWFRRQSDDLLTLSKSNVSNRDDIPTCGLYLVSARAMQIWLSCRTGTKQGMFGLANIHELPAIKRKTTTNKSIQ